MSRCKVLILALIISLVTVAKPSPWLLTSPKLPVDYSNPKFMPTLGNGQLAVTPYLNLNPDVPPSIFVNCLYNGDSWNSHRARLSKEFPSTNTNFSFADFLTTPTTSFYYPIHP